MQIKKIKQLKNNGLIFHNLNPASRFFIGFTPEESKNTGWDIISLVHAHKKMQLSLMNRTAQVTKHMGAASQLSTTFAGELLSWRNCN